MKYYVCIKIKTITVSYMLFFKFTKLHVSKLAKVG